MKLTNYLRHTCVYTTYIYLFKNDYWQRVRAIREFYRPFVRKNSLVFDIGANRGIHSKCLLDLGARVVAVEPHPANLERLREFPATRSGKLTVLPIALSDEHGPAEMHIGEVTDFSTLSPEWLEIAQNSERFSEHSWSQTITVLTATLDTLIRVYGRPDFIKIDVEGFESQVLDGLSSIPCPMMFEFNSEWMEKALECIHKPCFPAEEVEFNYAVQSKVMLKRWVCREELAGLLTGVAGDVLVRRKRA